MLTDQVIRHIDGKLYGAPTRTAEAQSCTISIPACEIHTVNAACQWNVYQMCPRQIGVAWATLPNVDSYSWALPETVNLDF